jgi:sphinganine C4-monooxygenase
MNTTACPLFQDDCSHLETIPFYYSHKTSLFAAFPDQYLALALPIFAYWSLSLFFHYLDISGWKWLERYRIHESSEVKARNIATRSQVAWAVLLQQVIQTLLGLLWLSGRPRATNHLQNMQGISIKLGPLLGWSMGGTNSEVVMHDLVYFVYWWSIPILQFLAAMYVSSYSRFSACTVYSPFLFVRLFIDTWQYFLHRLMHTNKFLYRQFHSWHHRLYVPYAFGSLYNHPVEGFVLDTLGAALAEMLTGMSTRQAMVLFTFSTLKTVDDHCGYNLPFDPLQLFGNNADYHDIHHQV